MRKSCVPASMVPVVGLRSWGTEVAPVKHCVVVSGQVGADAQDHAPEGLLQQTRLVWSNIDHVLQSAGRSARHIVRTGST